MYFFSKDDVNKMKRMLFGLLFCVLSSSIFADCPRATATDLPAFCESFKVAAQCHCTSSGLPQVMCNNVRLLYQRLMVTFGSLEKTCAFQRDTTPEDCMDSWKCFLQGGRNAAGKLCNGTGRPCP